MSIARRINEYLGDDSPEGEAQVREHLKNTEMLFGGAILAAADYGIAMSADSWQADILAVPTAVAGLVIAQKGFERTLDWMKRDPSESNTQDT